MRFLINSLSYPTAPVRPVKLEFKIYDEDENEENYLEKEMERGESKELLRSFITSPIHQSTNDFNNNNTFIGSDNSRSEKSQTKGRQIRHENPHIEKYSSDHSLLAVEGNLICTLQPGTSCIVLWVVDKLFPDSGRGGEDDPIHPCVVDDRDSIMSINDFSATTGTTQMNSSVLENRHLRGDSSNVLSFSSSPSAPFQSINRSDASHGRLGRYFFLYFKVTSLCIDIYGYQERDK
jgi:hypothetical protein